MIERTKRVMTDLLSIFISEPRLFPEDWRHAEEQASHTARLVADYTAGMTDRYAVEVHTRLLG